ncbi:MAG: alpha/beta hydrolase [Nitriliruptorales bacterium]|nr:alpha/beta hydrolase [Nitriliruptorales bacterium]
MRNFRVCAAVSLATVSLLAGPAGGAAAETVRTDVTYELTNLNDGAEHTVHGYLREAPCDADTVVLLQHGLSYTGEAWDVPGYSYSEILAEAGYDVVAIDRLGYGRSVLDDGYNVSTFAFADMTAQLADILREDWDKVVLGGHSAGAETTVQAVGLFGASADAVIPMGYHTYPDPQFLAFDWSSNQVDALQDDFIYFMGTPERRTEMFYTENADPAISESDTAGAVETPSGEVQTISFQPSRIGAFNVTAPVFAQLAEDDRLFPSEFADFWASQFVQAASVTIDIVPGTGHTYMLHHEGPAAAHRIVDWLSTTAGLPGCEVAAAGGEPTPVADVDNGSDEDTLPATGGGMAALALILAVPALVAAGRLRAA